MIPRFTHWINTSQACLLSWMSRSSETNAVRRIHGQYGKALDEFWVNPVSLAGSVGFSALS